MPRDNKVAILKDSLAAIGRRIDLVLENKRNAGEDVDRWKRHLWTYVTLFLVLINSIGFLHSFILQFCYLVLAEAG